MSFLVKALHHLPPETAHTLALKALGLGLVRDQRAVIPSAPLSVFGLSFRHPLGLAAGFDKNADGVVGLAKLGFSFIEVGTTTPQPQPGNPKPRLFRLTEDAAIINRLGFNNKGHAHMQRRLDALPTWVREQCRIGVNLGKNKDSEEAAVDYCLGVSRFAGVADYLVVNISSPNTPNLRDLQRREPLYALLSAVREERDKQTARPPLLVKIAPDLEAAQAEDIAIVAKQTGVDGLIISNTTITRPESLKSAHKRETGGLSGQPLRPLATDMLAIMKALVEDMPLIGVGGISTPEDIVARKAAGAALVQIYTSFIYGGAGVVPALSVAWKS